MKRFKLIAMAFAAISMFSCSKEDVPTANESQLNGKEAVVTLQLKGTTDAKSRATGDGTANEGAINNMVVFFFTDGGALVGSPKFVTPTDLATALTTTTDAKSVYVIANTGVTAANFTASIFKDVKTLANLQGIKGDLFKSATDGTTAVPNSTQTTGGLWMSGTALITYGAELKGTAAVTLNYVASKIKLVITDNRINKNLAWGANTKVTIEDQSIALLFSGAEGSFFGTTEAIKVAQTKYYSGLESTTKENTTVQGILNTNLVPGADKKITNAPHHFYVFPQKDFRQPIIVAIKSLKKTSAADAGTAIYYPVHFNANDVLKGKNPTYFESSKLYELTITLNGDVNTGGGSGGLDPETPVTNADITLTVTAATWGTAISVNKIFN